MVIVGKPGTGKSTKIRRLVRAALEQKRRVLVVTPHEDEWLELPLVHPRYPQRIATYRGGRRLVVREREPLAEVCRLFKHGLLVFDDCRYYIDTDAPIPFVRAMLISCRQDERDFIAVGHGFTDVPPLFFKYATHYMVFATTDNVVKRKNCVANYSALEQVVGAVNAAARTDPHTFKIIRNE